MNWLKSNGLVLLAFLIQTATLSAGGSAVVSVTEPAGIRRGNYPITVLIHSSTPLSAENVAVSGDSSPTNIQVDKAPSDFGDSMYTVEFADTFKPNETRRYEIRYGNGISGDLQPIRGHVLTETDETYIITNKPYLTWQIPKDLDGLIASMNFPPSEHIRTGGRGIYVTNTENKNIHIRGDGITSEIIRRGPLAVHLRFKKTLSESAQAVVDLHFPVSRSWVEVQVRLVDPLNKYKSIANELLLNLDPPDNKAPTIADFGGGTTGYVTLSADQHAQLSATGKEWSISRGNRSDDVAIFASKESAAEGWAHIMDRERCLAMAVTDFGKASTDTIRFDGGGRVIASRMFTGETKPKVLRAWYHFVFYPPQISAATGPQAMQQPLRVSIRQ